MFAPPRCAEGGDTLEELEAGDVVLAINFDCKRAQFDAFGPARGAVVVMLLQGSPMQRGYPAVS